MIQGTSQILFRREVSNKISDVEGNAALVSRTTQEPLRKPEARIAFGEGAAGRFATTILRKTMGPALKKMEEHGAMLLIRQGGKYLPTTITKLVISQVETKLSELPARALSNPKLVMALIGSIQLKGLGMTIGTLAAKSGVSLVSSAAMALTVEQFKRQVEQAESNKPLADKLWKILGDVADALNPLSSGGTATHDTLDSQRTFDKAYQGNFRQLQEAQRQLDAQKPGGQENTNRSVAPAARPVSPPPPPPSVGKPPPAETADLKTQLDAYKPGSARPAVRPGDTDTRPSESVAKPRPGPAIVGARAEQYTAQQLADRMQKFAGTTGGVQPSSVVNWTNGSESGKFKTIDIDQATATRENAQAVGFNKKNLTVQLAVPIDYWDQTSKQHAQSYLQFKDMDPRTVLTRFNDYLVSLHATQSFNVRGNFEEILKNSGLSLDGLKQRVEHFDNADFANKLPIIGGKQATLKTGNEIKNMAVANSDNSINLRQGKLNRLSIVIPTSSGSYDSKPRQIFVGGVDARNAAALLQYAADHGLMRPNTSLSQVIQANGLFKVIGLDACGKVYVLPKAALPDPLTEKEVKDAWVKLGESELGEEIVRHASREGMSHREVLDYIRRNPGKNLNEILSSLRDGNLDFAGTPPTGGGVRRTNVAGDAGDADLPDNSATTNEQRWAEYNASNIAAKSISESILSNYRDAVSKTPDRPGRVIDIGPGRGETVLGVLNAFPDAKVLAIDIDANNLENLKNIVPDNQKSRFETKAGNVTAVDFGRDNTSLVVAERLFPHLTDADVKAVLKKSHQALQPEGIVVCDFFTTEHINAKMNRSIVFRSIADTRKLVEKDFDILKEENVGPLVKYTLRKREPGAQPAHRLGTETAAPATTQTNGIKFDAIPNVSDSELNSEYFNGQNLSLKVGSKEVENYTFAGRTFSAKDLAKIARAPDGSEISIATFEGQPNRIRIEVKNPQFFSRDASTELWVDSKNGNVNIKTCFLANHPLPLKAWACKP